MVGNGPGSPSTASAEEFLPERCAHGHIRRGVLKADAIGSQLIQMRRVGLPSPGAQRVAVDVVTEDDQDVGSLGRCDCLCNRGVKDRDQR